MATTLTLFCTWLTAGGRSVGTVKLRRYHLERLHRVTGRHLLELGSDDLLFFVGSPGWSPETRKSARTSVATFYAWAHAQGHLTCNPAASLPHVPVPQTAPRPTPDHVLARALLRCTNERDTLMLLLAAYAGLRRAEIAQVHPARDWTADGLLVRGKGGRTRLVPVAPELSTAIRAELTRRAAGTYGSGWATRTAPGIRVDGYLFPNREGQPIHPDVVGKTLKGWLGPDWSGHTLRHRFATKAYAVERDLLAVQELLGHSKPETTRRYVQTPTDAKRRAVGGVALTVVA